MNDQDVARHITSLQARMNRIETLMQQLLVTLTTSGAQAERSMQMQTMLQELRLDSSTSTAASAPEVFPQQERPELAAIRQARLSGDNMKAIKLYRSLYGCSLQEAQSAIERM